MSAEEYRRVRRSIAAAAAGKAVFSFKLKLPSVDWKLNIGSRTLGSSFGVKLKNYASFDLSLLSGSSVVDVDNKIWFTLFVLGAKLDIFRAELCYKGRMGYDLDILKEFSYDDVKRLGQVFNTHIPAIVNELKDGVRSFVRLSRPGHLPHFVDTMKQFLSATLDIMKETAKFKLATKAIYETMAGFSDLPPVVDEIAELVNHVTELLGDVRKDVFDMHKLIIDVLTVQIPWSWQEITIAMADIRNDIKNIIRNPKTTIQSIGHSIKRINDAMFILERTRNEILNSSFFQDDTKPYWYDIESELEKLTAMADEMKLQLEASIENIEVNQAADKLVKTLTCKSLTQWRTEAMQKIMDIVTESLKTPLEKMSTIFQPFAEAAANYDETVKGTYKGFNELKTAFQEARKLTELVFGSKVHKAFPREFMESQCCGDGFWPSTGNGRYPEGVMLRAATSEEIVAPFNGIVIASYSGRVVIELSDIDGVEAVITNIEPKSDIIGGEISSGEFLGYIRNNHGSDSHIHLSMRLSGSEEYIDPSRYVEKRDIVLPYWKQDCDHYFYIYKGVTLHTGYILGSPNEIDETPKIPNAPNDLDVEDFGNVTPDVPDVGQWETVSFDNVANDLDMSSTLNNKDEMLTFEMYNINLQELYDVSPDTVGPLSLTHPREIVDAAVNCIQGLALKDMRLPAGSLPDFELRLNLGLQGRSTSGSRNNLIDRFNEGDKITCKSVAERIFGGSTCSFEEGCSGFSCGLELKFQGLTQFISTSMTFDSCKMELTVDFEQFSYTFKLLEVDALEGSMVIPILPVINCTRLQLNYKIEVTTTDIKVDMSLSWCFNANEECEIAIDFLRDLELNIFPCSSMAAKSVKIPSVPSREDMMGMAVIEVLELLEETGCDAMELINSVHDLREYYHTWTMDKIKSVTQRVFPNEFELFDFVLSGPEITFGPSDVTFVSGRVFIPFGPVPGYMGYGVKGSYGAAFKTSLHVMSMKIKGVLAPSITSSAYGSLGVRLPPISGEVRIEGVFVNVRFPATAEMKFNKFPLKITTGISTELVPVAYRLQAVLLIDILGIKQDFMNVKIYSYDRPAEAGDSLTKSDEDPDDTPPQFSPYAESSSKRKRRSAYSKHCSVEQLSNLDYTEPAFKLEVGVDDDMSDVLLTYSVGTYRWGHDVIKNEQMGGNSILVPRPLPIRHRLYFTVTATNSGGGQAKVDCELDTYDMLPPGGRVAPEYYSTSNPTILHGSIMAIDESPTVGNEISVGLGRGRASDQTVKWSVVTDIEDAAPPPDNDPLGLNALEYFTAPRSGKLVYRPYAIKNFGNPIACSHECLKYNNLLCQSFNYDYGSDGTCELIGAVESNHIHIHENGNFHYFERKGIGQVASLTFPDVLLSHNQLYYLNNYLINTLGYESTLTARPTICDLTPPSPSNISTLIEELYIHTPCENYIPSHLTAYCVGQTPIDNYRYFVDGPDSRTIFNGAKILIETTYTRANTMMSANWDGIHDNETGILIYEFAVGRNHCHHDIHPHRDPHAHIASTTEWTHQGIIHPLLMPDGEYHITLRSLNKIDYGGPLALVVCHSIPYTIDTVPPIVYSVTDTDYDEEDNLITVSLNATDETSGIYRAEMGLGNDKRNNYVMEYRSLVNETDPYYNFKLPDGVPVWIKIRVADRVELRDVGHPDAPIVIDTSPPLPGTVSDGDMRDIDIDYQNSTHEYCATWHDFTDPESGIVLYFLELGTSPGQSDVTEEELSSRTHAWCWSNLDLVHTNIYFLSVTAVNGALKPRNTTVISDGVYIDKTPPEAGWVVDGLYKEEDVVYSSAPASVSACFDDFTDFESGIDFYTADIYQKRFGSGSRPLKAHSELLDSSSRGFLLHHFHLSHNDEVHTEVIATNGAKGSTIKISNGYKIDLTDPLLEQLVDGTNLLHDQMFTASTSMLSAAWDFRDPESGIKHYWVAVYQLSQGKRTQIYPESGIAIVDGQETGWTITELGLSSGLHYSIRVTAVNGAGLSIVHDTTGVVVDPTPPQLSYVHAGVLTGASEEVVDGYVTHNDPENLPCSWKGYDFESGISAYMVAIGITEGGHEVYDFLSMGASEDSVITGINLPLTSESGNYYYVTVYAVNGAGTQSAIMSSSPIKLVAGDVTGVATDGPDPDRDVDYQIDTSSLTAQFQGFESEAHGIHHYEFCVGTRAGWDDIVPYSGQGITTEERTDVDVLGMGGKGRVQVLNQFNSGTKYHVTIRAVTGAGNILEAPTDGAMPDITLPDVSVQSLQSVDILGHHEYHIYTRTLVPFTAKWNIVDMESNVGETIILFGTFPGDPSLQSVNASHTNSLSPGTISLNVEEGTPIFMDLQAENMVGLRGSQITSEVIADTSLPISGTLNCPDYIGIPVPPGQLKCTWSGFRDPESEVKSFYIGLGYEEDDDSLISFSSLDRESFSHTFNHTVLGAVTTVEQVLATLIVTNGVGDDYAIYSDKIAIDVTPPHIEFVIEIQDITLFNVTGDNVIGLSALEDGECQRSLTDVTIAWKCNDDESEVDRFELALGRVRGSTDIWGFRTLQSTQTSYTVHGLNLAHVIQVFATIRCVNAVGLSSTSSSNGIYISRISSGIAPLGDINVWDGNQPGFDQQYQYENTGLSATWDFSGDPCPVVRYEWEVRRFDGIIVLPFDELPQGQTQGVLDDIQVHDGESYYSVVRATNALSHVITRRSNGVTISLEPLLPGIVRDGDIVGTDLNFWPYVDKLSANWDRFGSDKKIDPTLGRGKVDSQSLDFYEVSIGTDRRYPLTRENIHPFVNVGLNKTWTFEHLSLVPNIATYYITVRAHSISTAVAEVTSNGIKVGYEFQGTPGEVQVPRFLSQTESIEISWSDFILGLPIQSYYWAISSWNETVYDLDCRDLLSTDHDINFDIVYPTLAGMDTFAVALNLNLQHGSSYSVVVVAMDQSGECEMTVAKVTVDLTPSELGTFTAGDSQFTNLALSYTPNVDVLRLDWAGYVDNESAIVSYELNVFEALSCDPESILPGSIIESVVFNQNVSEYSLFNLGLQADGVYFATIVVVNGAGLDITTTSPPIVVDSNSPEIGHIQNGPVYSSDRTFQTKTDKIEATMIYSPMGCPNRDPITDGSVNPVSAGSVVNILNTYYESNTVMDRTRVSVHLDDLELTLQRDVRNPNMVGGAVVIERDNHITGTYTMMIRTPSSDFEPVTSVLYANSNEIVGNEFRDLLHNISNIDDITNSPPNIECGFGYQIHTGQMVETSVIFVWAIRQNETWYDAKELEFDPSLTHNKYTMKLNEGGIGDEDSWHISVYVNDKEVAAAYGITPLNTTKSSVQVGVYSRGNLTLPMEDVFDPATTQASLKDFRFPMRDISPCNYGNPFTPGGAAVVEFHAAVGTEAYATDVQDFVFVGRPCIPCLGSCIEAVCDPECDAKDIQEMSFTIEDLDLDPRRNSTDEGSLLSPYYITVMNKAASGISVLAVSNAFYVDDTPPVITTIHHLDVTWNLYEAISYQGNNHTIAAYWEAEDPESLITVFQWAVGTAPGETDVLPFESVGLSTLETKNKLHHMLEDKHVYFVTVRAQNGAGVWSQASSAGVTVWLDAPDLSDVKLVIAGSTPLPDNIHDNSVLSDQQDAILFEWPKPRAEENIESIHVSITSSDQEDDLLRQMQVEISDGGVIEIDGEGFHTSAVDTTNATINPGGGLHIEPGKIISPRVMFCNKAHVCSYASSADIAILRNTDKIASTKDGMIHIGLDKAFVETKSEQIDGTGLLAGELSENDLMAPYSFSTSSTYMPYIVRPQISNELAHRNLKDRIYVIEENAIFIATFEEMIISGGLHVSMFFSDSHYPLGERGDRMPVVLGWCNIQEYWVDISRSCREPWTEVNWDISQTTAHICDPRLACLEGIPFLHEQTLRQKRSTDLDFTGGIMLTVASISQAMSNLPPVITSPDTFHMDEDETSSFQLTASDPDGDNFIFLLDERYTYEAAMTLSVSGLLHITPKKHFNGHIKIRFLVVEQGLTGGLEPLSTESTVTIVLQPVNDNPVLMMIEMGENVIPPSFILDRNVEQNNNLTSAVHHIFILLVAYDVDADDSITILTDPAGHGQSLQTGQVKNVLITNQDCGQDWNARTGSWEQMREQLWDGSTPLYLPHICNVDPEALEPGVNWAVLETKFTPEDGYFGSENFKAISEDPQRARSDLLDIGIHVLEFKCENEANCSGPSGDETCESKDRALGFDEGLYSCVCQPDFSGRYCSEEIDDCQPEPCPHNYTCIDGVAEYSCTCDDIWWPCYSGLLPWELGLIIGLPLLALAILASILLIMQLKKHMKNGNRIGDSSVTLRRDNAEDQDFNEDYKQPLPWVYPEERHEKEIEHSVEEAVPAVSGVSIGIQTDDDSFDNLLLMKTKKSPVSALTVTSKVAKKEPKQRVYKVHHSKFQHPSPYIKN